MSTTLAPHDRQPDLIGGTPEPPRERSTSRWIPVGVISALALGAAGLGVGVAALTTMPAAVSGPAGPTGAQGPQGVAGPAGPMGPQGSPGTVTTMTVSSPTTLTSAPDPVPGTVLEAKTECPTGKVLLGGGAVVSAPGVADRNVHLWVSAPLSNKVWHTVGMVTAPLGPGVVMTMKPYVLCGA